jgi:hypothetical protein
MSEPRAQLSSAVYLLNAATQPGDGPIANTGTMYKNQSVQVFTDPPGVVFHAHVEGSMDGIHWFPFGQFTGPSIKSDEQHTIQYFKGVLDDVDPGGAVTMMISWC